MKTIEELQSELDEKDSIIEAINAKSREILTEKKKLQAKFSGIDPEAYNKIVDENEALKVNYEKLSKQYKADTDKLNLELSSKDGYLQKTLIEDGLTKSLLEAGIKKEQIAPAIAMLKNDVKLQLEGTDYKAIISDKGLSEYVPEWAKSQQWLNLGMPDVGIQTGGQGANGNSNVDISNMTPTQMMALGRK